MIKINNVPKTQNTGFLNILQYSHPAGCRGYIIVDSTKNEALVLDPHLDYVNKMTEKIKGERWTLKYIVDTHTHADHPSGAAALFQLFPAAIRVAHEKANHKGVTLTPNNGDTLELGDNKITVMHSPGHTPDHIILITDDAIFTGDTLLIGTVARTDFLGGDAGSLFDTLQSLVKNFPENMAIYPSHDYKGHEKSTIGKEKTENPWLQIKDRAEFIEKLTANPPPLPANIDELLRLNREGVNIPEKISAETAVDRVKKGGASSIIDVRSGMELDTEHIPGSQHIPLEQLEELSEKVFLTPAPRMLLCQSSNRATTAREKLDRLGIGGLSIIDGGLNAYISAGGTTIKNKKRISLERQVRITAGIFILTGIVLSYLIHPLFIIISAFVGAGLIFAGVTDTCGMGMMLLKMPWNKVSCESYANITGSSCAILPHAGSTAEPPKQGGCSASIDADN